jgi:protein-disulfide isomerase
MRFRILLAALPVLLTVADLAPAETPAKVTKVMGTPVSAITIEVYSDFQCPYCKIFHETWMPRLIHDYVQSGRAYLIQHEFPLSIHAYSKTAAYYATAADRVGKYGEVCDVLFRKQSEWEKDGKVEETVCSVLSPAEAAKVRALAKDPTIVAQVQKEIDLGTKVPVPGTPTLIVTHNGRHYPVNTLADYSYFAKLLDSLR